VAGGDSVVELCTVCGVVSRRG